MNEILLKSLKKILAKHKPANDRSSQRKPKEINLA